MSPEKVMREREETRESVHDPTLDEIRKITANYKQTVFQNFLTGMNS